MLRDARRDPRQHAAPRVERRQRGLRQRRRAAAEAAQRHAEVRLQVQLLRRQRKGGEGCNVSVVNGNEVRAVMCLSSMVTR